MAFAEAFPNYRFDQHKRPTVTELANFFRVAREINPERGALMERILSYDSAVRRDRSKYEPAVTGLLRYLNGGEDHLICSLEDSSFFLWSDRDVRLLLPSGSGSGRCILRYLFIRSLELKIAGKFDLSDLHRLPIESLDVRGCPNLVLRQQVSLPLLRRIHIHPSQISRTNLARFLQTAEKVQIVEDESPESE